MLLGLALVFSKSRSGVLILLVTGLLGLVWKENGLVIRLGLAVFLAAALSCEAQFQRSQMGGRGGTMGGGFGRSSSGGRDRPRGSRRRRRRPRRWSRARSPAPGCPAT